MVGGTIIAQRYVVEAPLGTGGMAEVFRVRDKTNGSVVALKSLNQELVERRPVVALLFEREYHTLAQLAHPRIVGLRLRHRRAGPYYTMELLDGEDLHAARAAAVARSLRAAARRVLVAGAAALAQAAAPRREPAQRALHARGRAKLIDFGAMAPMGAVQARRRHAAVRAARSRAQQPLDARTDLYVARRVRCTAR